MQDREKICYTDRSRQKKRQKYGYRGLQREDTRQRTKLSERREMKYVRRTEYKRMYRGILRGMRACGFMYRQKNRFS